MSSGTGFQRVCHALQKSLCHSVSILPICVHITEAHAPNKGAACRNRLYQEHSLSSGIAHQPVDQLPIERESVHAAYMAEGLIEAEGLSRDVEVRSGHDGSDKEEEEEHMEGYSSSTELLRRCFALLCGCAGLSNLRHQPHPCKGQPRIAVIRGGCWKTGDGSASAANEKGGALAFHAGTDQTGRSYNDLQLRTTLHLTQTSSSLLKIVGNSATYSPGNGGSFY